MSMLGNLFGGRARAIEKLREKLICMRFHFTLISKRMSYLESHHPEIFQQLINKESPVAKLREHEKQKIMQEVDGWLEGLK